MSKIRLDSHAAVDVLFRRRTPRACPSFLASFTLLIAGCLNAGAQERLNLDDVAAQFEELLSIADASERRRAIHETASHWAEADPTAAYSAVMDQAPGTLRDEIEGSLVTSWLAVDTASALRFVGSLEEPPAHLMAVSTIRGNVSRWRLPVSPDSDLVEILEIADELPVEIARYVRLQIAGRMARSDPPSAAQRIRTFPPEERRQAGMNIAREYASVYPDGALAWAQALQEPDVEREVVQTMVAADPYGMLARAISGEEGITLPLVASGAFGSQNLDRAQFGSALAHLPRTTTSAHALSTFAQSWLVHDQDAALEWLANSGVEWPPEAILRAANRAGSDPDFAAQFAQRLQGRNRSEWIENVGSRYGRQNPERALEWLEQFRSEPAYTKVVANIIPQLAITNGPRAAQLIQVLEGREWLGATWTVARQWAKNDPVAAARWADGLPDNARGPSVRAAIDEWHSYDPAPAESWVLGLPPGAMREESLLGLVTAVASEGQIPPERMLDAFSTESARQNAILGAINMLTLRNREGALELYESQLTHPELRQHAEALLHPPTHEPGQRGGFFGPVPTPSNTN